MQVKHTAQAPPGAMVEEVDAELLALPAPPRGRRLAAMTLMALTVVTSMGLLGSLRSDIRDFFAPATAIDLGEATAVDPAALAPNAFVRVEGTPSAAHTVRYGRLLSGTTYVVFPLAGQRDVFVQVPLEGSSADRHMVRREFSGRLVTFGQLGGRFARVRSYLGESMGVPVSSESFLVLADEPPGSYLWAVVLAAICLLFVLLNVLLMLRWFRPLPAGDRRAAGAAAGES
jgi:hypothetical protein